VKDHPVSFQGDKAKAAKGNAGRMFRESVDCFNEHIKDARKNAGPKRGETDKTSIKRYNQTRGKIIGLSSGGVSQKKKVWSCMRKPSLMG